jgi:hypothetical protein
VHVTLPGLQQQTKAQAAQAAATAPAVSKHATWGASATAVDTWSSTQMWVMFAAGWLFTPSWWLGVAAGLTTGKVRQCFLRKRAGLTQGQQAAWVANLIMTVVSTLVVVLVCSIYLSRAGTHTSSGQPTRQSMLAVRAHCTRPAVPVLLLSFIPRLQCLLAATPPCNPVPVCLQVRLTLTSLTVPSAVLLLPLVSVSTQALRTLHPPTLSCLAKRKHTQTCATLPACARWQAPSTVPWALRAAATPLPTSGCGWHLSRQRQQPPPGTCWLPGPR